MSAAIEDLLSQDTGLREESSTPFSFTEVHKKNGELRARVIQYGEDWVIVATQHDLYARYIGDDRVFPGCWDFQGICSSDDRLLDVIECQEPATRRLLKEAMWIG